MSSTISTDSIANTELSSPLLLCIGGPIENSLFEIGIEELSIGRGAGNTIVIPSSLVSRHHCVIRPSDDRIQVIDQQSANGTFVNGSRIMSATVRPGDRIAVGPCSFLVIGARVPDAISAHDRTDTEVLPESVLELGSGDEDLLVRVCAALHETSEPRIIYQRLLDLIDKAIPNTGGLIVAADGDALIPAARRVSASDAKFEPSPALLRRVMHSGVSVLTGDNELLVPILGYQRIFGAAYLAGAPEPQLSAEHLRLAMAMAGIAGQALQSAFGFGSLIGENERLRRELAVQHDLIGESAPMRQVYEFIGKVAPSASTILILGESGTGKELVARAIHRNSPRSAKPIIAINCAAITETLLESELFGHERGAFTGAVGQKRGVFEAADGGTLFLDEIGELSAALQAKLLRVLQERTIQRVGSTRTVPIDIRIIAATNRDLSAIVKDGRFRQDLFFRINVVTIRVPPLRERKQDIPLLAAHFRERFSQRAGMAEGRVTEEAMRLLCSYEWPGNVRELENCLERAVLMCATGVIRPEDLPEELLANPENAADTFPGYYREIAEAKRRIVARAVAESAGNLSEASRRLGIHRNHLHRLLNSLGLKNLAQS